MPAGDGPEKRALKLVEAQITAIGEAGAGPFFIGTMQVKGCVGDYAARWPVRSSTNVSSRAQTLGPILKVLILPASAH